MRKGLGDRPTETEREVGMSSWQAGEWGCFFFFSSRRRHTRWTGGWSSDVCSSDLSLSGFSRLCLLSRRAVVRRCPFFLGLQHHFDALILLLQEHVKSFGRLVQCHAMRDKEGWVDIAVLDALQQGFHVAVRVGLTGLNRNTAVHQRTHGYFIYEAAVDAGNGNRASVPAGHDCLAQGEGTIAFQHEGLLRTVVGVKWSRRMRFHSRE